MMMTMVMMIRITTVLQVFLSDMTFHNMVPTAPPWEEDDEIP